MLSDPEYLVICKVYCILKDVCFKYVKCKQNLKILKVVFKSLRILTSYRVFMTVKGKTATPAIVRADAPIAISSIAPGLSLLNHMEQIRH